MNYWTKIFLCILMLGPPSRPSTLRSDSEVVQTNVNGQALLEKKIREVGVV